MTVDEMARIHAAAMQNTRPWTAEEFARLLEGPHVQRCCDGHGFAIWRVVAQEAELLTIAVEPPWQGRGMGRALMADWMPKAARNASHAFLEVESNNEAALALYEKTGFQVVAQRRGYYSYKGVKSDAIVMRAVLAANSD